MFKVGDKIVCVDDLKTNLYDSHDYGLTIGKIYEIINFKGKRPKYYTWAHIINDRYESQDYQTNKFVSILEFRKMKIEKIKKNV